MPQQHPNTERFGGPGASHEDRTGARPDPTVKDRDDPDRYSRHSKVSGGGGERDIHHAHEDRLKGGPQSSDAERSKP